MSSARLILLLLCFCATALQAGTDPEYDEEAVKQRLELMHNDVVKPRYDKIVRSYIRTYTIKSREKAERILGRQVMYFPIFEQYLTQYELPHDLKYLSVVESALEPRALSHAGAKGLWQFMEETGRYYGLEINELIDERCDPHKSSDAAARYLSRLYERFNDWELAIAAYNSGGGRVSRAMKRSRSKNFWRVRDYLPRETRNYVPAYIAASYLMKYYEDHGLLPNYPVLDEQITGTVRVHRALTFYEIAQVTGVSLETLELLNPSYVKSYIPESTAGHLLTLPERAIKDMTQYLEAERPDHELREEIISAPVFVFKPAKEVNEKYEVITYTLAEGQSLQQLARTIDCTLHQLMAWNKLKYPSALPGAKIKVYKPRPPIEETRVAFGSLAQLQAGEVPVVHSERNIWEAEIHQFLTQDRYLFYWVKKRSESVFEIAQKLPGISAKDIMKLNGFETNRMIKRDSKIKIKEL